MYGLQGKRVLITGATSGIGRATAVHLASLGAHVAINYVEDPDEADGTLDDVHACLDEVGRHGVSRLLVGADVSVESDVVDMVRRTVAGLGGLDVLVNNAGIQLERPSEELSAEDFDAVLGVNLRGAFLCAREALRHFLGTGDGGAIVNVSSVHETIPKPGFLGYSVSKGGMGNLTRTLALEYAARGIRVNGIGPGATVTPINAAWADDPAKKKEVAEHIPMGRPGSPEEMARVIAFLAGDHAAYITGQTLYVDGGLTLYPAFRDSWSS